MAIEEKYFNGARIDSDSSIEYTDPNAILGGYNFRVQTKESNREGLVCTVEGTRELTRDLPDGDNKIIGSRYFPEVGKAYIFLQNSLGNHKIEEFDPITETFTTLYEDLTDSGNEQLLSWSDVVYIKDIILVQSTLLYWCEFPNDVVRRLDVNKAADGGYGVFSTTDFYIGVVAPRTAPVANYLSDQNYNGNKLDSLYQFRYRFGYGNNEYSTWSAISNRPTPVDESGRPSDIRNNNVIDVRIPLTGQVEYETLEISFRAGMGDWLRIKEVSRSFIEGLPLYVIPIIPDPPAPLPISTPPLDSRFLGLSPEYGGYRFSFYNDGLYLPIAPNETDQLYDAIPNHTRALEAVNDSVILLGNNTYQKVDINPQGYSASIETYEIEDASDLDLFVVTNYYAIPGSGTPISWRIETKGTPNSGDVISARVIEGPSSSVVVSFTVTSLEAGNRQAVLQELADLISSTTTVDIDAIEWASSGNSTNVTFDITSPQGGIQDVWTQVSSSSVGTTSRPAMKLLSAYQTIVYYYDSVGRPIGGITGDSMKVITPGLAEMEFWEGNQILPQIRWQLPTAAPEGAATYTIGVTSAKGYQNSIYINTTIDLDRTSGLNLVFDITPLFLFNEINNSGNMAYDYTPGDMVNIIANINSGGNLRNWVNDPVLSGQITGLEVDSSDPDDTRWYLIVRRPQGNLQLNTQSSVLIEIYTPKPHDSEQVFYEVGGTYQVVGGNHEVTSGIIRGIDTYFKQRSMIFPLATGAGRNRLVWVEDFNYSEDKPSAFPQFGRPRLENDLPGTSTFKTEIRYGREWISGSDINDIIRFYPEDVYDSRGPMYGASNRYGGIQYLLNRENRLVCVQELKVGYIPVNRSIIEDLTEQEQVGISSKLLNPITYSTGPNMGIGDSWAIPSLVFEKGMVYFVDPHEMLPVRATTNSIGYVTYKATDRMKALIRASVLGGEYMTGMWDDEHNEYLLVIGERTEVWNEAVDGWVPYRTFTPSTGFSANDRLYTTNGNGTLYIHDDEVNGGNLHGVQYDAMLDVPLTSPGVKTYQSIAIHSDDLFITEVDGGATQLGHVFDLIEEDFDNREGIFYANLPRDYNTDPVGGDRLKGRWIRLQLKLQPDGDTGVLPAGNLLKLVCKSSGSTPNE